MIPAPMQKSSKILLVIALLLAVATGLVMYFSSAVFLQLFIALALAYILNPAVIFLEGRKLPRIAAILIVFTAATILVTGFTVFLVYSISNELSSIQLNLPGYARHLYEITPTTVKGYLGIETPERLVLRLDELLQQLRSASPDLVKPFLAFLQKAFTSTASLILAILGYLIIPVYLFYLLEDLPQLKQLLDSFVPVRYQEAYHRRVAEVDTILSSFVRGQLSVCAILAVLYSLGLYVIGIDLAIAIGTLAGITFIIPYVGTIVGIVLSVFMAFLKFQDIIHPLLCLGWFGLVQGLEGMVITPKIVGTTVGLHPLVAIVALLIGGQIFGIMGMLLAVPTAAVLQVFLRSLAGWYRTTDFFLDEP